MAGSEVAVLLSEDKVPMAIPGGVVYHDLGVATGAAVRPGVIRAPWVGKGNGLDQRREYGRGDVT